MVSTYIGFLSQSQVNMYYTGTFILNANKHICIQYVDSCSYETRVFQQGIKNLQLQGYNTEVVDDLSVDVKKKNRQFTLSHSIPTETLLLRLKM